MFICPEFDPVALKLGPLSVHWYALSYLLGFLLFFLIGRYRIRQGFTRWTEEGLDDFLTYGVLGVILGGRLGYVLFYQPAFYFSHPLNIFKVWQGGMSFHGGLIGVLIAMYFFARKYRLSYAEVGDFVSIPAPLGLASGRIGNFINGELWGRVTDPSHFWATGFPRAASVDAALAPQLSDTFQAAYERYGMLPRHPSTLYEFALEGIVLFLILWFFAQKKRPDGQTILLFFIGYGIFRFLIEFAREPDSFLGLLSLGLTMGQWLSLPMIIIGVVGFVVIGKRAKKQDMDRA